MPRPIAFLLFALPFLAACMLQPLAPTQLLREQVQSLNDETRWGRVDLASERVLATYRPTFLESRRAWGRDVRIADTELTQLILASDLGSATSTVEITWYDQRTMEVSSTILRQRWVRSDSEYLLDEETIIDGDETLLELEEEEEETEAAGILPSRG